MSGTVVEIYTTTEPAAALTRSESANLEAGKGIVGDRYHGVDEDAQITLVDADTIDRINGQEGWALTPADTRRNIVTRGIDLNQWETGRFRVGDAILEGVELCEPCAGLGALLADDSRTSADVVRALAHAAGLRARILTGAEIRAGDPVSD